MRKTVRRIRFGNNLESPRTSQDVDEFLKNHPELKAFQKELTRELERLELSPEERVQYINELLQEKLNHLADALETLEEMTIPSSRKIGNSDYN